MPPKKDKEETGPSLAARFGRVKSNLKMGIVGLPNVGKSSLFNLLTQQAVAAENYPFCTIEPTDARCSVPDARYDDLISVWKPKSEYPAYLWCTDIAGLVRGASEGAGLGNAFLSHIQAVDGIYHVVRAFEDTEITHVDDTIDPVRDLETIQPSSSGGMSRHSPRVAAGICTRVRRLVAARPHGPPCCGSPPTQRRRATQRSQHHPWRPRARAAASCFCHGVLTNLLS